LKAANIIYFLKNHNMFFILQNFHLLVCHIP